MIKYKSIIHFLANWDASYNNNILEFAALQCTVDSNIASSIPAEAFTNYKMLLHHKFL